MLPKGWMLVKLGNIASTFAGGTPSRENEEFFSGSIPWVKSGEVNKTYIDSTEEYISETALNKSSAKIAPKGSVLVALYGATAGVVGRLGIDAAINQAVLSVNGAKGKVENGFLFYTLSYASAALLKTVQGSGQPNLSKGLVESASIALPPIPEQKQIAEVLGSVDAAIEATKEVIDQTKKVKQGLLQTLLTRGIGHTKFKDSPLGEIPESWEVRTIGELAAQKGLQTGPFGSQLHARDYTEDGIPVVMPKDIIGTSILTDSIARIPSQIANSLSRHIVCEGDILFGRRGDIGRCCLIGTNEVGFLCGTGCLRFRPNFDLVVPTYLIKFLQLETTVSWLNENAVGQTMLNLNTSILGALPIALPPLPEQIKIGDSIDSLDAELKAEAAKLFTLQALKKGLMNDLLTGKVRVDISAKVPVNNVVPFPQHAVRTPARKQALLAAEITAQLYDLQKFGVTKREKIMDICDRHIELNERTERRAVRREFGSYDEEARRIIDGIFESEDWFKIRTAIKNGHNTYKYLKGSNFRAHRSEFDDEFGDVKSDIQHIIDLLRDLTTQQCEIIDTLYTAWNDLIIERNARNENPLVITEAEIFTEVLSWHPSKCKIPQNEWEWGMRWLRQKSLIPTGRGASSKPPVLL